jgi:arabinolytic transcriptional activator AraR
MVRRPSLFFHEMLTLARWSAAFSLARDLKLNQEVDLYVMQDDSGVLQPIINCGCSMNQSEPSTDFMTEVHREERRRTWWLLFLMDRHLALCYNRPLALLEAECKDLLLPLDDITWQSGSQPHSHGTRTEGPRCIVQPAGTGRPHGPPSQCTGPGLFEFFLPLMTITGHLLDFNRAKNHPVLVSAGCSSMWSSQERQILLEIDSYQASLDRITPIAPVHPDPMQTATPNTSTATPSLNSSNNPTPPLATPALPSDEPTHHLKTSLSYASHILCVLRILVSSKWDPISLFEDSDFWTSSPSFHTSMSHTITATTHINHILALDPDITFMPYFFGIQLLHGSLLLLLVAYRLQSDSGKVILDACESVVRATEACFVTLPTDYQRQFRNVLRGAIKLGRGRGGGWGGEGGETEKQLASVLARYRWSRNGGGLAR